MKSHQLLQVVLVDSLKLQHLHMHDVVKYLNPLQEAPEVEDEGQKERESTSDEGEEEQQERRRNQNQNWIRKPQKVCRSDYDIDYKLLPQM